jgi:hypothetical protein
MGNYIRNDLGVSVKPELGLGFKPEINRGSSGTLKKPSTDHDPGARPDACNQPPQRISFQRHASRGWGEARPGHVHEHRAAAARDPRPGVVVQLDDEIVEMIGALEPIAGMIGLEPNRLVVMAVARVLTPAVVARMGRTGRWSLA